VKKVQVTSEGGGDEEAPPAHCQSCEKHLSYHKKAWELKPIRSSSKKVPVHVACSLGGARVHRILQQMEQWPRFSLARKNENEKKRKNCEKKQKKK